MKKQIKKVKEFQKAFSQHVEIKPALIEAGRFQLRFKLMEEENQEYLDACKQNDIVEIADALTDQLYILCGTILSHGMQDIILKCFDEVHRSNMSKLNEHGQPVINGVNCPLDTTKPFGKVLKSDKYSEPDLKKFL